MCSFKGEIFPYMGVGQLRFGMGKDEVVQLIGEPESESKRSGGKTKSFYLGVSLIYSAGGKIQEIELYPESKATYKGMDIFRDVDSWSQMRTEDGAPVKYYGVVVLFGLGIALPDADGPDQADSEVSSITVFAEGVWDDIKKT